MKDLKIDWNAEFDMSNSEVIVPREVIAPYLSDLLTLGIGVTTLDGRRVDPMTIGKAYRKE